MKIILSENYSTGKLSQVDIDQPRISGADWHEKIQRVIGQVSQGTKVLEAVLEEFRGLPPDKIKKIEDFVLGALGEI